jgi:hypothetical protein
MTLFFLNSVWNNSAGITNLSIVCFEPDVFLSTFARYLFRAEIYFKKIIFFIYKNIFSIKINSKKNILEIS